MDKAALERQLSVSKNLFYTDYFLLACTLIAIITCLFFLRKEKNSFYFLLYSISAFILMNDDYVLILIGKGNLIDSLTLYEDIFFSLIEFIIFGLFFKKTLHLPIAKKMIAASIVLYCFTIFIFFIYKMIKPLTDTDIRKFSDFLISAELFLLFALCLIFYMEILYKNPGSKQKSNSSLWIVNGLFLYCLIIIPFFMLNTELRETSKKLYDAAYAVHYFTFGCLFLAITKALMTRKLSNK